MPRIGPKIRHTRLLKGLTLRDLAEVAQCSESLLSKIENGRANPSLKMIHRIASALGTPVAGLFQLPTTRLLAQTEDVVVDARGYIYISDKNHGVYILRLDRSKVGRR